VNPLTRMTILMVVGKGSSSERADWFGSGNRMMTRGIVKRRLPKSSQIAEEQQRLTQFRRPNYEVKRRPQ
jgi:hypothetical protein